MMPGQFVTRLVVAFALVILAVTGAMAHAGLISTTPADGDVLPAAPAALSLTYTEPVSPISFSLLGFGGAPVPLGSFTLEGPSVRVALPAELGKGSYLFSWRVTSADGHPVNGTVGFAVGAPSGTIAAAATDPVQQVAIWLVRALQYVALFFGVGSLAFGLVTPLSGVARRPARALAWMGLLLVPAAIGLEGTDLLGVPMATLTTAAPWVAALGSSYATTEGLFALAFLLAMLPGRWTPAAAAIVGALAPAFSGHASTASPQLLMRALVFLHIASLMAWIGALLPLGVILRQGGAEALRRFSRLIPYPVGALLLSGLTIAAVQLGPDIWVWPNGYGALLAAKLVLVAILLALALWNRLRLTAPALAGDTRRLRRSISLEIGLAVLVFGIVAGWRFTPPPRVAAEIAVASAPTTTTLTGANLSTTLVATPGRSGPVSVAFELPVDAKSVNLSLSNPSQGVATISKAAVATGNRAWRVDGLLLPVGGSWAVAVDARTDEFDITTLRGTLTLRPVPEVSAMPSSSAALAVASSMLMAAPAVAGPGLLASCPLGQSFSKGQITVSGAFARATPPHAASAGAYLVVHNGGTSADTLTGASTEAASDATLHAMKMTGNVMEMSDVTGGLPIPAGGTLQLNPDGYHLMLTRLNGSLTEGQCLQMTLHFTTAGDLPVTLNIGRFAQDAPPDANAAAMSGMDMGGMDMSATSSMSGM